MAAFSGDVVSLGNWARLTTEHHQVYSYMRGELVKDPGWPVYLYAFGGDDSEDIYVGVTRNPQLRFAKHRRRPWWARVTHAVVERIDCRWHDGAPCSRHELDVAARRLEGWLIDLFEPTENLALGPVM